MMMYHPNKSSCKQMSSSVNLVETVISDLMSSQCDPELKDSKPIFLHDTLAHNDALPYKVRLQKVQQLRRYRPDEIIQMNVHWNFEPFL